MPSPPPTPHPHTHLEAARRGGQHQVGRLDVPVDEACPVEGLRDGWVGGWVGAAVIFSVVILDVQKPQTQYPSHVA